LTRNILALGYQERRFGDKARVLGTNLENFYPNSTVAYMKSPLMQNLHAKIGDQIMTYMLTFSLLFVPVGVDSLMQTCGPPLHDFLAASSAPTIRKIDESLPKKKGLNQPSFVSDLVQRSSSGQ
jgi:hypothetical protein